MQTPTPPSPLSVLVVDDETVALKAIARILTKQGYRTVTAATGHEGLRRLNEQAFDLVVTDVVLGDISGLDVLKAAKRVDPNIEVIVVTGFGSVEGAIAATKEGAFFYLQKPIRPDELRSIVGRAAETYRLAQRLREIERQAASQQPRLLGTSASILAIKDLIRQIEHSDANVLITGDSGTGKELVAHAIHDSSLRRHQRFLGFNCASLTDDLLANELFGHEKGAFTGADQLRRGLIENADHGTIFFDEVGDMSLLMQARLLRVVQERELIRVGGTHPIPVDIRIIAATNKSLKTLVSAGRFRHDLYFRLNVIALHLPDLAQRREDIPVLTGHFLRQFCQRTGRIIEGFSSDALALLMGYDFPGNVRELENIVERSASLAPGPWISVEDLPPDLRDFDTFTFRRGDGLDHLKPLREVEWDYIQYVLEQVNHNKSEAARILGIDRVSLYRRIKRRAFDE